MSNRSSIYSLDDFKTDSFNDSLSSLDIDFSSFGLSTSADLLPNTTTSTPTSQSLSLNPILTTPSIARKPVKKPDDFVNSADSNSDSNSARVSIAGSRDSITSADFDSSPALHNADAILNHFENLSPNPVRSRLSIPISTVSTTPTSPINVQRSNSISSANTLDGPKKGTLSNEEFELLLGAKGTKHISTTPEILDSSVTEETFVIPRRSSLIDNVKNKSLRMFGRIGNQKQSKPSIKSPISTTPTSISSEDFIPLESKNVPVNRSKLSQESVAPPVLPPRAIPPRTVSNSASSESTKALSPISLMPGAFQTIPGSTKPFYEDSAAPENSSPTTPTQSKLSSAGSSSKPNLDSLVVDTEKAISKPTSANSAPKSRDTPLSGLIPTPGLVEKVIPGAEGWQDMLPADPAAAVKSNGIVSSNTTPTNSNTHSPVAEPSSVSKPTVEVPSIKKAVVPEQETTPSPTNSQVSSNSSTPTESEIILDDNVSQTKEISNSIDDGQTLVDPKATPHHDTSTKPVTASISIQTETTEDVSDLEAENIRLRQELSTMKLMVQTARAQTHQMKILKEAAEARFEQLARVAHRKLVRAMVDKN
ncbi:hypothetical protein HDV02_001417 [Globomyces sp. JEL0801]|nr:hypothetical protein HDV02_001417 [Globomyces sp. JEL0801]